MLFANPSFRYDKKMEKVSIKNQFLVHLSTVAVQKNGSRSWGNIQSAHWVSIRSASTRDVLDRYTPCNFDSREEVIEALAITHCELVLIHPYREGNGRTSRLLATLMALQAGLPLLDFSGITGKEKQAYFQAVQLSMGRNYEPMKNVFRKVIARSEREN